MRSPFWYAILWLVVLAACKQEPAKVEETPDPIFQPKGGMADLVYNPVRSDGSLDSSYLPIMTWKEDRFDFGTIFEGDVVTHDFGFTNTGTAPLLITRATSTCGCTIPEWPKKPVPPDSTSFIRVKFNSLHKEGGQKKVVTIFANTFPNTTTVTIQGNVDLKK